MLAETVRNNLKDVQNLKMRTKATKFSSLFQSDPTVTIEETPLDEILEACNLRNYVKKEDVALNDEDINIVEDVSNVSEELESSDDAEIEEYIVENPNEVIVNFPLTPNIELKEDLPFFRALSLKLANL